MYPPHDLGGGYELTWRSAVEHMRSRYHEVRVLTSDYRAPGVEGPPEPDVYRELRSYWRDHGFPRVPVRERIAIERRNGEILERHLAEQEPHVVNWWGMGSMSLGLIERVRRARIPAVGVVGDEWMVWGPRADGWLRLTGRRPRAASMAERRTGLPTQVDLSGAATWLFNSDANRRRSIAATGPLADARVVHPGVEELLFRPVPEDDWAWRLAYVGRMDPRKGVGLAIEALALLPAEATLDLVGGGDPAYESELRAKVAELGLGERVRLRRTRREEVPRAYADADAVLFPVQWEEPWGLVPLEAMAIGRPVVASGTGGSAEYLRHEENCLIYRPRDSAEALAAAVRRLADDSDLRDRLREAGHRTAARFTAQAYDEAITAAVEAAAGA
jgi:glycogen synthase